VIELESHKQFWRYVNSGWRLASEAKVKLDKRNRRLIVYLVFKKSVEAYKPRGFISVDVNENHVAVLIDGRVYLFETGFRDIVLGYYYRRKRVQERYDKLYGANSRVKRRVLKRLKERGRRVI
jgi:transposase